METFRITQHTKFGIGITTKKAKSFEDLILHRMTKTEKRNWFALENLDTKEEFHHDEWLEKMGFKDEEFEILRR